jgi:hypothetical protein
MDEQFPSSDDTPQGAAPRFAPPADGTPFDPSILDTTPDGRSPLDMLNDDSPADSGLSASVPRERRGRARERVEKRRAARGSAPSPNPFAPPTTATGEYRSTRVVSSDGDALDNASAFMSAAAVSDTLPLENAEHAARSIPPPRAAAPTSRFALPSTGKPKRRAARRDDPLSRLMAIRLPFNRNIAIAVGSVLFVGVIVVILGLVRNRPSESADNALWVGDEWTASAPDAARLTAWIETLRANQVGTIFAWVSQLTPERTWFGEQNLRIAADFATAFSTADPTARVYGWLFIPVDGSAIQLDDAAQTQIADMARRVVTELDFDGVMLHVDPIADGDENYLALLRAVRTAIDDAPLAVAVPPDWTPVGANVPQPPQIAPGTLWDTTYKQRVALLVDEIVVQSYNTGFSNPTDYSAWIAYQVGAFTGAIAALDVDVNVYIGVPTYDADPPRYNPAVENIASAVVGIRSGTEAAGAASTFLRGTALYADWTTDAEEWDDFAREWLDR